MKFFLFLLIIGTVSMFTGCKSTAVDDVIQEVSSTTSAEETSNANYTEEDIIGIFKDFSYSRGCIVTDCVLAKDNAYGLIGIVQYTDENGSPCNLSFVKDSLVGLPVGLDADGTMSISDDSTLNYAGNGMVSLKLNENETNQNYDYAVEYSSEDNKTHIKVSSKKSR